MFPRHKRLTRTEFPAALKSGRRISSTHFSAILPRDADGYAVIVPKKVAHLSVTRHRIKRRVLAALRRLGASLPPSVVLYPRASVLDIEYDELRRELITLLS